MVLTLVAETKRTDKGTVQLKLTVSSVPATASGGASTDTTIALSKVFAIEKFPLSADPANPLYRFSHVCSVAELLEYPEDDYSTGEEAYFRVNEITMLFDTPKVSDLVLSNVRADLLRLQNEYNRLPDATPVTETFVIGS